MEPTEPSFPVVVMLSIVDDIISLKMKTLQTKESSKKDRRPSKRMGQVNLSLLTVPDDRMLPIFDWRMSLNLTCASWHQQEFEILDKTRDHHWKSSSLVLPGLLRCHRFSLGGRGQCGPENLYRRPHISVKIPILIGTILYEEPASSYHPRSTNEVERDSSNVLNSWQGNISLDVQATDVHPRPDRIGLGNLHTRAAPHHRGRDQDHCHERHEVVHHGPHQIQTLQVSSTSRGIPRAGGP